MTPWVQCRKCEAGPGYPIIADSIEMKVREVETYCERRSLRFGYASNLA